MNIDYQAESIKFCNAAFTLMDYVKQGKNPLPFKLCKSFEMSVNSHGRLMVRDLDKPKNCQIVTHMFNDKKCKTDITRVGDMLAKYLEELQVKCESD